MMRVSTTDNTGCVAVSGLLGRSIELLLNNAHSVHAVLGVLAQWDCAGAGLRAARPLKKKSRKGLLVASQDPWISEWAPSSYSTKPRSS